MCGICGIYTFDPAAGGPEYARAVQAMTARMQRRGPDDEGAWQDPQGHLALGFRRLAVIDPTPAGHQPMLSADGRSALVLNGEIYNFQKSSCMRSGGLGAMPGRSIRTGILAARPIITSRLRTAL
jgi:asparagine synthase (glutamine-hydrolysing)